MAEKQTNKEKLKEITDSIEANIKELFQSEKYTNYLRTMSRFHKYSFNNTMLINMQKPDATLVAGFGKWEKLNRHVKRGEKGIRIIAPTPFKKKIEQEKLDPDTKLPMRDENGDIIVEEKEVQIPMFRPVTVFDVSQTYGEPLPTIASDLHGNVEHFEVFMEALRRSSPVPLEFEQIPADMDGYFSRDDQRIAIREGMSEVQTISAAVHEITHAKLHNIKGTAALDDKERYQEIELFDKPAIFSNGRIDREKLPEGLFCYDLRGGGDDPGAPVTVEDRFVVVNHAGTVITAEALDFGEDSYLVLGEDMNFNGGQVTLKQFFEQMFPDKVEKDRNTEEVEAESVSFTVCSYYGIETGENSFGYIASWSNGKELKELRSSLEIISKTADGLITDIDLHFREICKERGIDLAAEQAEPYPDEQFYKVNEGQYLHIQRCDTGYDYTFYDAASKALTDGGQLDNPDITIYAAAKEVCEKYDVLMDEMSVVACELPEEFAEAMSAAAPRDYHAELAEHFAREDDKLWNMDTRLDEYPMPDKNYGTADLEQQGILDSSLLPISKETAAEMVDRDMTVYAVTSEGTVMAFDRDEVEAYQDGSLFSMLREEWEQAADFKEAVQNRMNCQRERETAFLDHSGNSFAIYQMKLDDDSLRNLRYMPLEYLQKQGLQPNRGNYELAYTGVLHEGESVYTLWDRFNDQLPADYMRPSMSISDIVVLRQYGVVSCYYVDSFGFQEVPDFLQPENYLKSAEMQTEDDYNMVDGIINNGTKQLTVAELEEQAKNGQPISLLGLAQAIHREKQEKSTPKKKPSILEKIRRPLPSRGKNKTAPEKSAERE